MGGLLGEPDGGLHRLVDAACVELALGEQVVVVRRRAPPRVVEHLGGASN